MKRNRFLFGFLLCLTQVRAATPACDLPMNDSEARVFYRDLAAKTSELLKRQRTSDEGLLGELPVMSPADRAEFRKELEQCALHLKKGGENCLPKEPKDKRPSKRGRASFVMWGALVGHAILPGVIIAQAGGGVPSEALPASAVVGAALGAGVTALGHISYSRIKTALCNEARRVRWMDQMQKAKKNVADFEDRFFWEELRRLGHDVPVDANARETWWRQRLAGNAINGNWVTDPQMLKTHTDHFGKFIQDLKTKFPDKKSWEYETIDAWERKHKASGKVPPFFAKKGNQRQVIENMFEILQDMHEMEEQMGLKKAGINLKNALLPLDPITTQYELTADDLWGREHSLKMKQATPHESLWGEVRWKSNSATKAFRREIQEWGGKAVSPYLMQAIHEHQKSGGHVEVKVEDPVYGSTPPKAEMKRPGLATMNIQFNFVDAQGQSNVHTVPIQFSSFAPEAKVMSKESGKWKSQVGAELDRVFRDFEHRSSANCEQAIADTMGVKIKLKMPTAAKELMER